MSLAELPVDEYEARIERFVPQHKEDMCYSTSLANVLNDLGSRQHIKGWKRYSLGRMNELCGYRSGLGCKEDLIPKILSDELRPLGYRWNSHSGPGMEIDFLEKVVTRERCSLPLVGVHHAYLERFVGDTSGRHKWDHVLVAIGINSEDIYYYDPYEKFIQKKRYADEFNRTMKISVFLDLWDKAEDESRWIAWAEPLGPQQSLLNEHFNSEEHDHHDR